MKKMRVAASVLFAFLTGFALSQVPALATHDAFDFALCNPSVHHNYHDINWHFSSADGPSFSSTA